MKPQVTLADHKPRGLSLHDAVVSGLSQTPKTLPPKFFYDDNGSRLFDAICDQPEYYLPDVERQLLVDLADELANLTSDLPLLIEPGAGSLRKIRLLLDSLQPSAYVPMDISCEYLHWASHELGEDYPWLPIHAACVDFTHSLPIPAEAPVGRRLLFFPGSSIGNFHRWEAQGFLELVARTVGPGGMLLIGVDTKKSESILNAAYNDAAGVTAEFNLNLLQRIRRELDAEIDLDGFDHHAFYNADAGRIEMHLVSRKPQAIRINGSSFHFRPGESVHTECSYKYTPDEFIGVAAGSGLHPLQTWLAPDDLFAVYLLEAH